MLQLLRLQDNGMGRGNLFDCFVKWASLLFLIDPLTHCLFSLNKWVYLKRFRIILSLICIAVCGNLKFPDYSSDIEYSLLLFFWLLLLSFIGRIRPASPYVGSLQPARGAYVGSYGYQQPLSYGYQQGMVYPPYGWVGMPLYMFCKIWILRFYFHCQSANKYALAFYVLGFFSCPCIFSSYLTNFKPVYWILWLLYNSYEVN